MFGKCLVCVEKDLRIKSLQDQIDLLSKLVLPPPKVQVITEDDENLDSLFENNEAKMEEDNVNREAQLFLSGDYDGIHGEI
jgi:hypothetical protein